ncbi:MAG: hypothetical protein P8Q37_03175, partial [Porticoccaceae bacterium]|nr:hypothetical protein [Porticoccaceae bacterium]
MVVSSGSVQSEFNGNTSVAGTLTYSAKAYQSQNPSRGCAKTRTLFYEHKTKSKHVCSTVSDPQSYPVPQSNHNNLFPKSTGMTYHCSNLSLPPVYDLLDHQR